MKITAILAIAAMFAASLACGQTAGSQRTDADASLVDGLLGTEWSAADFYSLTNFTIGSPVPASDLNAQWGSLWDDDYLYIIALINDDALFSDGPFPWEDDAVEFFLDGDNSGDIDYDGLNDYQYVWSRQAVSQPPAWGSNSRNSSAGIISAGSETTSGWVFEAAIPWTLLLNGHADGVTAPSVGLWVGIDVQVDDDDDGGARDTVAAWSATSNNAWDDPSVFGDLELMPIPEPSAWGLLAGAALTIFALARKRKQESV